MKQLVLCLKLQRNLIALSSYTLLYIINSNDQRHLHKKVNERNYLIRSPINTPDLVGCFKFNMNSIDTLHLDLRKSVKLTIISYTVNKYILLIYKIYLLHASECPSLQLKA